MTAMRDIYLILSLKVILRLLFKLLSGLLRLQALSQIFLKYICATIIKIAPSPLSSFSTYI